MEKEKLFELAIKLGVKQENFEFGYLNSKEKMEANILAAAKHMGLIEEKETKKRK